MLFKINDRITIVCERRKTRMAFKHEATLYVDSQQVAAAKICYQNRTWERYEFESVLCKVLEKAKLSDEDRVAAVEFIAHYQEPSPYTHVVAAARMGEILAGDSVADKNAWKVRMLKAGIPGFSLPDDWAALPEEVKTERLDKAMRALV